MKSTKLTYKPNFSPEPGCQGPADLQRAGHALTEVSGKGLDPAARPDLPRALSGRVTSLAFPQAALVELVTLRSSLCGSDPG